MASPSTSGARGRVSSPPARRKSNGEESPPSPAKLATNGRRISAKQSPPSPWWCLSILSPAGLEHIATHQYKGGKYTPLDNVLNPVWLWFTEKLPLWVAPNLVTFTGLGPLCVVYGVTCYVNPRTDTPNPSWLLLVSAATTWFYQTMDAMDGKQARRTGSSTPLGQLFDHGCDCLASIIHCSQAHAVLAPGGSISGLLGTTLFQFGFFLAQWEEFHTGILQTSAGPVGVTETQYVLMIMLLGGGIMGHDNLVKFLTEPSLLLGSMSNLSVDIQCLLCFFFLIMITTCFNRTFRATYASGKLGQALAQLLPVVVIQASAMCMSLEARVQEAQFVFLIVGLHFFFITVQMIIFSMAKQDFPVFQLGTLVPLVTMTGLTHYVDAELCHQLMAGYSTVFGAYLLWWNCSVIRQITSKLKIEVFRIKPKAK